MPLAVAPGIVPDGGDGEDPEGDNDVDTAESEEEGGRDGDLSFEPVRSLACARLGQRHSGRLEAFQQHFQGDMAVHTLQPTLVQIRTRSRRLGSFFPELARSSKMKHEFVPFKHSGRCRSLFHSMLPF